MKLVFSSVLGILSVVIVAALFQTTVAQNQTAPAGQVTNFTKLVEEQYTFDRLGLGFSLPDLEVLYESPSTLVLRGEGPQFQSLGEVIDRAKQNGFGIDSVTVFTESGRPVSGTVRLTDVYTIFMSKE